MGCFPFELGLPRLRLGERGRWIKKNHETDHRERTYPLEDENDDEYECGTPTVNYLAHGTTGAIISNPMAKSGTNEESASAAVAAETKAPKSPNAIPVYRVGMPFFGSTQQFRKNPFQFHLDGYHQYGSIYRTWIEGKNWIVL